MQRHCHQPSVLLAWRPPPRWLWSLAAHGIEVEAAAACICDAVRTHRPAMAPPWWYELEPMRRSSRRVHPCRLPHTQLRAMADAQVAAVVVDCGNALRLAWRGRWPPRRRPRSALLRVVSASGPDLQPSHRPAPSCMSATATHELMGPVSMPPSYHRRKARRRRTSRTRTPHARTEQQLNLA